ncbi:MAG: hypothetical protein U1E76_00170 [Planctomycetota bacterium]
MLSLAVVLVLLANQVVLDQVHLGLPLPDTFKPGTLPSGDRLIYQAQGEIGAGQVVLEVVRLPTARSLSEVAEELDQIYQHNHVDLEVKSAHEQEEQGFTITLVEQELKRGTEVFLQLGRLFAFADGGAAVLLRVRADHADAIRNDLEQILESIKITLAAPDPQWPEADVKARIAEIFTPAEQSHVEVFRTRHYIIFTDSSAGKLFGSQLEDIYARFAKVYPFADHKTDRLLPVYLFKLRDGYIDFYARYASTSRDAAARSGGHSWKDYYATSYTDPHATVHAHEGAHQIVKMRLRLGGGGSWFQEGIAEYFEHLDRSSNLKNAVKSLIRRGKQLPLRRLMEVPSLLQDAPVDQKSGDQATDYYSQAATVIWFFHKGPHQARFMDIIRRIGRLRENDVDAIGAVLKELTGLTIEQLDEQWKAFVLKLP